MSKKFEVSFEDRNEQRQKAKKLVWYRATGRKRYCVYENKKTPIYTSQIHKPQWTLPRGYYPSYNDFVLIYQFVIKPQYTIKWLLPQEATALTIIGHQVVEL